MPGVTVTVCPSFCLSALLFPSWQVLCQHSLLPPHGIQRTLYHLYQVDDSLLWFCWCAAQAAHRPVPSLWPELRRVKSGPTVAMICFLPPCCFPPSHHPVQASLSWWALSAPAGRQCSKCPSGYSHSHSPTLHHEDSGIVSI